MAARLQMSEKEFYLHCFRHRSMILDLGRAVTPAQVQALVEELVANHTLVVVVTDASSCGAKGRQDPGREAIGLRLGDLEGGGKGLARLTGALMERGRATVLRPGRRRAAARIEFARHLAVKLGIHKLVLVDERGGLGANSEKLSFVTASALAGLRRGRRALGGWSSAELAECSLAVQGGIESLNMTTVEGLAAELFSYEGSGTLLSAREYLKVGRLGLDDFAEALRLVAKGEREGFLRRRDLSERSALLLCGYGAWFEGHRLAGIAGLETRAYARRRLGEIVGLYTITRFKGEGVGVRLLDHLVTQGRSMGLRALFACTANARASRFFERAGFCGVEASRLPQAKWAGRKGPPVEAFWLDIC